MKFPDGFRWGVTSSSLQSEGVGATADWSAWERSGRVPQSGSGAGLSTEFRDDFAQLQELGFTDIRLGIEWARIEPVAGKTDHGALDLYSDVVRAARDAGLAPWLTLHQGTLPGWFNEDALGFRDTKMLSRFWMPHVDRCAEAFGTVAEGFVCVDDPVGWALRGYHLGSRPPGLRDAEKFRDAVHGALEADHMGAQHLSAGKLRTMAVRGVPTVFALAPEARPHVDFWTSFLFDVWIDPLVTGELSVPDRAIEIRESWVDDFDLIGLSFDHPIALDAAGALRPYPLGARRADNGFAPLPDELGVMIERLTDRLPNRSFVIAANGVATTDDDWREEVVRSTVDIVGALVDAGFPLVGYFHDTGFDGYEGPKGFDTQRGLIGRDRVVKESGRYLSSVMLGE